MNLLSFSTWLALGDLTVPGLTPQESAALILLAASLLVFRAFRERYLLIWTLGWLAYFVSRWTLAGHCRARPALSDRDFAGGVRSGRVSVRGRDLCLHPCPGTAVAAVADYADRNGLCRGPGLVLAGVDHPARGAGSCLPHCRGDRGLPPDSLPLGALGNRSLAAERQHAAAASALGSDQLRTCPPDSA